jgi:uncharacterized protein (DUF433 family)
VNHGLEFGAHHVATTWRPNEGVLIHPSIQFGTPCIEGTRIPTETIWALKQAGDSVEAMALMYGIEQRLVKNALEWEELLGRAA